nr:ribokinase [uncultured Sellimonas sp.]
MMQVHKKGLVFGSLNLDYVYELDHIVNPGETISSRSLRCNPGGKGLNQAIALAKAGGNIWIAGKIGEDGSMLKQVCENAGVNVEGLMISKSPTGNAIIQVDSEGRNSIILFPGANRDQTEQEIIKVLEHFSKGDYLFLQNEINGIELLIQEASKRGMKIVLNPSPFEPEIMTYDLEKIEWIILNEVEVCQMTGEKMIEQALKKLKEICPGAGIVLTLGEKGSRCFVEGKEYVQNAYSCNVEDTTAAGDTFTGYFFAHVMEKEHEIQKALDEAARAATITVSRKGAAETIPYKEELYQIKSEEEI